MDNEWVIDRLLEVAEIQGKISSGFERVDERLLALERINADAIEDEKRNRHDTTYTLMPWIVQMVISFGAVLISLYALLHR